MRFLVCALACSFVFAPSLASQAVPAERASGPEATVPSASPVKPPIAWETISIHTHDPADTTMNWGDTPNGIEMKGVDLRTLMAQAYSFGEMNLRNEELVGLPGWARDTRYDVVAHVAPEDQAAYQRATNLGLPESIRRMVAREVTPEMLMMRNLLEGRFGLVAHYEMRVERVYALLIDKGGPKLKEAADPAHGNISWSTGSIKGAGIPAPFLAITLEQPLDHHVVDQTGLKRSYDFDLHFQPATTAPSPDTTEPDLFTAVREQLGLRLETAKASEPVLVIDKVHPPTPN